MGFVSLMDIFDTQLHMHYISASEDQKLLTINNPKKVKLKKNTHTQHLQKQKESNIGTWLLKNSKKKEKQLKM